MNGSTPHIIASDRPLSAWIVACVAALGLVMAWPAVAGNIWHLNDLGAFHLPLRKFYAECLASGANFHWMPNLFSGFQASAEGQLGAWHPWHWLLYRYLPLKGAWAVELLTPYFLTIIGMRGWLGRVVATRAAAWYGAMAFGFSAFLMLRFVHPNAVAIICHLPFLLWAEHALVNAGSGRKTVLPALAIALLTASQVLLGYPQYVWLSGLAEAFFLVCSLRWSTRCIVAVLALKIAGLLLGGMQLAATMDAFSNSSRQHLDNSRLLVGSLHPSNIIQLGNPYAFRKRVLGGNTHESTFYLGAAPLLLLAVGQMRRRQSDRRLVLAALALLLLAFALACGRFLGLIQLPMLLPVVGSFRLPSRYLLLFFLAASVLSARGFASLQTNSVEDKTATTVSIKLVIVSLLLTALTWLFPQEHQTSMAWKFVGPAMFAGMCGVAMIIHTRVASPRRLRWLLAFLAAFTAVDLGAYGMSYAVYTRKPVRELKTLARQKIAPPAAAANGKLVMERKTFQPGTNLRFGNELSMLGWRLADGYAGLEPSSRLWSDQVSVAALQAAGVKWVRAAAAEDALPELQREQNPWIELPDPPARFRLVSSVVTSNNPAAAIREISLADTAVVAEELPLVSSSKVGWVGVQHERPGDILLNVEAPSTQLLVTTERYHSGWRVESSTEMRIVRTNGDFLGVVVPPGQNQLRLRFHPPYWELGRRLTWIGWGVLGVCLSVLARRQRRGDTP